MDRSWRAAQVAWLGPQWEVMVGCGSLAAGRADMLVEKVTELGAWSLRPVLTRHSPYLGANPFSPSLQSLYLLAYALCKLHALLAWYV